MVFYRCCLVHLTGSAARDRVILKCLRHHRDDVGAIWFLVHKCADGAPQVASIEMTPISHQNYPCCVPHVQITTQQGNTRQFVQKTASDQFDPARHLTLLADSPCLCKDGWAVKKGMWSC